MSESAINILVLLLGSVGIIVAVFHYKSRPDLHNLTAIHVENTSQSKPNDTGIKSMGKMSHSAPNATEINNRVKKYAKVIN